MVDGPFTWGDISRRSALKAVYHVGMDHFEDKSEDWDTRPIPQQISAKVGSMMSALFQEKLDFRVMDFGAGTGLIAGHIAPHVGHIAAVDLSESMLAKLREKPALADKVSIHCQDILVAPLKESFDAIVSAMALHHVENTSAILEAFRRHLRPGGLVALADLDTEAGDFHPPNTEGVFHCGFDRRELQAKLERAGFREVHFETALEVRRENDKSYPIFFVVAHAP